LITLWLQAVVVHFMQVQELVVLELQLHSALDHHLQSQLVPVVRQVQSMVAVDKPLQLLVQILFSHL
jgi:hypothetical protein